MLHNQQAGGFLPNGEPIEFATDMEETYKECEELEHQVITHEHTIEHLKAEIDFLKQENKELENELITQEERFDEILGEDRGSAGNT
jgi:septal ring factor EnvC (AmiA/AmiB activator)